MERTSDPEPALTALWIEILRVPRVDLDASFFALGGDSLQLIELVVSVSKTHGVDFDYESFLEVPSLRTLINIVSRANIRNATL